MAQDLIKMRPVGGSSWTVIRQPDEDMAYSFETTYREDSTRSYTGTLAETPLFTVEQLAYKATGLTTAEVSQILQLIVGKRFQLHYFSPYYGTWRNAVFYVGKGSLDIGQLDSATGLISSLSFNMQGVTPL